LVAGQGCHIKAWIPGIWVRPKAMFEETITRDGQTFRRFSPISEEEALRYMKGFLY
jgi:hypothetical protein